MAKSAVPQKSLASQPVIPSEARNLFVAPRFLARKERSLGMTKASFAILPKSRTWRTVVFGDLGILILLALAKLVLHTLTNGQYGWHRDELDTLTSVDNARYLAWGYVSYPPVTPFIARMGLVLFGPPLIASTILHRPGYRSARSRRVCWPGCDCRRPKSNPGNCGPARYIARPRPEFRPECRKAKRACRHCR